MVTIVVICLSALFGYLAADRWLGLQPAAAASEQAPLVLGSVSAFAAVAVLIAFG